MHSEHSPRQMALPLRRQGVVGRAQIATPLNAGFTLMEVMVASILLCLVMTAVYTLLHSTLVSWRRIERGDDIYQEGRAFVAILQREVNNALPDAEHLFVGEDDEFTIFVCSEPLEVEEAFGRHVLRVRYYLNGKDQIIREEALVESPLPRPPANETDSIDRERIKTSRDEKFVVAEHVKDFEVHYRWMPYPERRSDPALPPERIEPLVVERHSELWRVGYPAAIELRYTIVSPEDKDKEFQVTAVAPIRLSGHEWTGQQLAERMGRGAL